MAEYPVLTENDGVTPAAAFTSSVQAGDTDGPREYWAVSDPGAAHGDAETISGSYLRIEGWDGAKWVQSGLPMLDERWVHATVFGVNQPVGTGPIQPQVTGSAPLGDGSVLLLSDIPKGTARKINFNLVVPGTANPGSVQWRAVWVTRQSSIPLGAKASVATGVGVVPGSRSFIRRISEGLNIVADGTGTVKVQRGVLDFDQVRRGFVIESVALDQNAADGALAVGQAYVALLTKDATGATTVTKSNKGAAPAVPATPANSVVLGSVTVHYNGGGSAIVQADVDSAAWSQGDLLVTAGAGLTVYVYPGEAVGGDRYQFLTAKTQLAVVDASTNYIWLEPDGSLAVTQTSAPPTADADLLATVTTAAGAVTSVVDNRRKVSVPVTVLSMEIDHKAVLSTLVAPVNELGDRILVLPDDASLDEVTLDLDDSAGWNAAGVKIDVVYWPPGVSIAGAGTTIYTSSVVDDARPRIAYNAASLRTSSRFHEVRSFVKGTRFAVKGVEFPGAGAPEAAHQIKAQLLFRR